MSSNLKHYTNGLALTMTSGDGNYIQSDPFLFLHSPFKFLSFPTSPYIKLGQRQVSWQNTTLGNTLHPYTSIYYQDITALANYFADWSCAYNIIEGSPHTIDVQVPWDTMTGTDFTISEYAVEKWELIPNNDNKSIIQNGILANPFKPPTYTGNYVVLPDVLKIAVQNAYDNKNMVLTLPSGSTALTSFIPYANFTLNLLRGGVQSVPSTTHTLKRTAVVDVRNINQAFQSAADWERISLNEQGTVNYITSTTDMLFNYPITNEVQSLMSPSYIKNISITGIDTYTFSVVAGWRVGKPHYQFITPNKVQLTQMFDWNEWIYGMYYIASPSNHFPMVYSPSSNPNGYYPA